MIRTKTLSLCACSNASIRLWQARDQGGEEAEGERYTHMKVESALGKPEARQKPTSRWTNPPNRHCKRSLQLLLCKPPAAVYSVAVNKANQSQLYMMGEGNKCLIEFDSAAYFQWQKRGWGVHIHSFRTSSCLVRRVRPHKHCPHGQPQITRPCSEAIGSQPASQPDRIIAIVLAISNAS